MTKRAIQNWTNLYPSTLFNDAKPNLITTTIHREPVDFNINYYDVLAELKNRGITAYPRRINKASNTSTEYVWIQVESKEAKQVDAEFSNTQSAKAGIMPIQSFIRPKDTSWYFIEHPPVQNQTICLKCGGNNNHKDCSPSHKCAYTYGKKHFHKTGASRPF